MKTTVDIVNEWIVKEEAKGRTRDDLHNTHFVGRESVSVLKKSGRNGYKLDTYVAPKVVFLVDLIS